MLVKKSFSLLTVIILFAPTYTQAQSNFHQNETYNAVLKRASTIEPLDESIFGENVNLFDGSTVLNAVDISLPTNSGMTLQLGRTLNVSAREWDYRGGYIDGPFEVLDGFWRLDVPYMHGTFAANQGWLRQDRCSYIASAPSDVYGTGNFYNTQITSRSYWSGNSVNIPTLGHEELLRPNPAYAKPSDGRTYIGVTRSNWYFSCLDQLKRGSGQGFSMISPDGTRYYFDWLVKNPAPPLSMTYCSSSYCGDSIALFRDHVYIYATRVEDRFGNSIEYTYDSTRPHRLRKISSNEASEINVNYGANGRISTATTGGRTWSYSYGSTNLTVAQPDMTSWSYTYSPNLSMLALDPNNGMWQGTCSPHVGTRTSGQTPLPAHVSNVTISSPSGVTGILSFRQLVHGTNNAAGGCYLDIIGTGSYTRQVARFEGIPKAYLAASLYRKVLSGAGLESRTWNYSYYPSWSWKWTECNQGVSCSDTSLTIVRNPDGTSRKYTYGNDADSNLHQLISVEDLNGGGVLMSRTEFGYLTSSTGQLFPDSMGHGSWMTEPFKTKLRPEVSRSIRMDGVDFRRAATAFDALARPTSITRSSSPIP